MRYQPPAYGTMTRPDNPFRVNPSGAAAKETNRKDWGQRSLLGGVPGPHGPVEQQGSAPCQIFPDIHGPSTFLAMSTDCRASRA